MKEDTKALMYIGCLYEGGSGCISGICEGGYEGIDVYWLSVFQASVKEDTKALMYIGCLYFRHL